MAAHPFWESIRRQDQHADSGDNPLYERPRRRRTRAVRTRARGSFAGRSRAGEPVHKRKRRPKGRRLNSLQGAVDLGTLLTAHDAQAREAEAEKRERGGFGDLKR